MLRCGGKMGRGVALMVFFFDVVVCWLVEVDRVC